MSLSNRCEVAEWVDTAFSSLGNQSLRPMWSLFMNFKILLTCFQLLVYKSAEGTLCAETLETVIILSFYLAVVQTPRHLLNNMLYINIMVRVIFLYHLYVFEFFFFSLQCSSMVNRWFLNHPFAGCLSRYSPESIKTFLNFHPKLSSALCGIIQVFFIMSYAQYFQTFLFLARKLLNPTHLNQCFVLRVTLSPNVGELRLE